MAHRRLTQAQVLRELPDGHLLARTVIDHAGQSESGRVGIEPQRLRERFRGRVGVRTCWKSVEQYVVCSLLPGPETTYCSLIAVGTWVPRAAPAASTRQRPAPESG